MLRSPYLKHNKIPLLFALASVLFYVSFAYNLVRTDSVKLLMLYTALFVLFYKMMQLIKHDLKLLTWFAFAFRAVFILAIPNLSQDFYRFIWDGRMLLEGFNPYVFTPESFISKGVFPVAQAQELYAGMGALSASHFTNYPPLNQLCFVIAGVFAGKSILGSVVVLRLLIIAADFGTLYFGKKLLETLNLPVHHIFWYVLNPFIIIELTGNLHFEGVMIFFLVWSFYLLQVGKWRWSAILFSGSVLIKLIPLVFIPAFFTKLKKTQSIVYFSLVCLVMVLAFAPFLTYEFLINFSETTALWFVNFEFNASLYYIVRAIGYYFTGFNIISYYGMVTTVVVPFIILLIVMKRRHKTRTQDLILTMLFTICLYYATATTVHPWYVAVPLFLSVFTRFKFALVWSFVVIFSYLAYSQTDYQENFWSVALEYLIVFSVFLYELIKRKPIEH